jgi:hypothetical protein
MIAVLAFVCGVVAATAQSTTTGLECAGPTVTAGIRSADNSVRVVYENRPSCNAEPNITRCDYLVCPSLPPCPNPARQQSTDPLTCKQQLCSLLNSHDSALFTLFRCSSLPIISQSLPPEPAPAEPSQLQQIMPIVAIVVISCFGVILCTVLCVRCKKCFSEERSPEPVGDDPPLS